MSKERPTYPLLIEESSNYAFTVRRIAKPLSFDKLRNTSNRFYNDLPEEIRDELHNSILHGTCMLSSEPELNAYMHDMGKMHNAKLRKAFANLSERFCNVETIDIIDYGCGQGLGIIAFADHIREASKSVNVRRIALIDPSEMALKRAALHASVLFPNATLVTIKKGFDDLVDEDIVSDDEVMTLHILSNVLDLAKTELDLDGCFDLNRFADLISANIEGENQFVGVEPLFNHDVADDKFPRFWKRVGISRDFKLICNKGEFVAGKNWTCVIVCGEKNNLSVFQKLSKEYVEVGEMSEGAICVSQVDFYRGGCCHAEPVLKCGFVDKSGNKIIPCEFSAAENFRNGLAFVENGYDEYAYWSKYNWGAINKHGEVIIPFLYESIEWVDNDEHVIASVEDRIDKYDKNGDLIDAEGRIIEYTSTDGNIVVPYSAEAFDAKIISNTYQNRAGRILFDKPITKIGEKAFFCCETLKSIKIPNSITIIETAAFSADEESCCSALEQIVLGEHIEKIGDWVFANTEIKSIELPNSVTGLGEGAFYNCRYLKYVRIPFVSSIEDYTFYNCESLIGVDIPNSVVSIGRYAFVWCKRLKNIIIPDSVVCIKDEAFVNCINVSSIVIGSGVVDIGRLLFGHETDYFDEEYPDQDWELPQIFVHSHSIPHLEKCADEWWYKHFKVIDNNTMPNSKLNSQIQYTSTDDNIIEISEPFNMDTGVIEKKFDANIISNTNTNGVGVIAFDKVITKIESEAFCSSNLTSIIIPHGVTSIGAEAFRCCLEMHSISLPNTLVSIGEMAFCECSLESVVIPGSVTEIGENAFLGSNIKSLICHAVLPPKIVITPPIIHTPEDMEWLDEDLFVVPDHMSGDWDLYNEKRLGIEAIFRFDDGGYMLQSNVQIYVPKQSVEAYKTALGWREHADRIFAIESDSNITPSQELETKEIDNNIANADNIELYPQQQEALDAICAFLKSEDQIFILKGYAGTGKTTMIKALLPLLHNMGKHTTLMAPTGRAAKVLMTKTGREASTIHRTIYSVNKLTSVRHDENGELIKMVDYIYKDKEETRKHDVVEFWFGINQERYADYNPQNAVYIVDEASMVSSRKTSNELFHFGSDVLLDDLLEYAELLKGGKIIFIGDPAQLPPVGDNCSAALSEVYFKEKGIGVTSFELTNVVRQSADSVILENAMMLRDLLQAQPRNTLTFKRCANEVEDMQATTMIAKYIEMYPEPAFGDTAIICYSNKMAKGYNDSIRTYYYPGEKSVQVGDILQVVKNYYRVDEASQSHDALYNGDFVRVLNASTEVEMQSAPVWTKPGNKRELISLAFRDVTVQSENGDIYTLKIVDSLLDSTNPGLTPNEHTALYINFRMRNPNLPKDKEAQVKMLMSDPYYNALNVKYGYAITGHKSQGGDWDTVFVDYDGRTGLNNDSLRWMYTATTRAKKRLYGVNMPNIQPFDKLKFRPITKLNKIAANAQIVGNVGNVDMLTPNATASQKAKCLSVISALGQIGCKVDRVEQLQYKDRYYIRVADVIERYDCTYNGAGYYTAYNALDVSENNNAILGALQSEECYTYQFDYQPSHKVLVDLHAKMRSICDELGVYITNIVEDIKQYNVVFFLKTTGKYSYIKFYFDKNMFVTYGQPYSDIETEDMLLDEIITKLS